MATKNVMIDIETMSTKTDALVLSIAAREFECLHSGPKLGESLLLVPDFYEQLLAGRRIDHDTQLWWSRQAPAAANHWRYAQPDTHSTTKSALYNLIAFIGSAELVWARGPQFDVAILNSLATTFTVEEICKYGVVRDQRTFCATHDPVGAPWLADTGLPQHHPLQDCDDQIYALWQHGYRTEPQPGPVRSFGNGPTHAEVL